MRTEDENAGAAPIALGTLQLVRRQSYGWATLGAGDAAERLRSSAALAVARCSRSASDFKFALGVV